MPAHKTPTKGSSATPDSTNLKSFFQNLLAKNAPNNTNVNQTLQNTNNNVTQSPPSEQPSKFWFK